MRTSNFSYTNSKGVTVRGAAAFLHFVFSDCGGIDGYNQWVISHQNPQSEKPSAARTIPIEKVLLWVSRQTRKKA